jgi:hypothetical protein
MNNEQKGPLSILALLFIIHRSSCIIPCNYLAVSYEQSEISFFHDKFFKNLRFVAESSLLKADS